MTNNHRLRRLVLVILTFIVNIKMRPRPP
jgi:hypothetical protein